LPVPALPMTRYLKRKSNNIIIDKKTVRRSQQKYTKAIITTKLGKLLHPRKWRMLFGQASKSNF